MYYDNYCSFFNKYSLEKPNILKKTQKKQKQIIILIKFLRKSKKI